MLLLQDVMSFHNATTTKRGEEEIITSMVARALRYGQRKQKNLRRDERGVVVNERAPKKKKVSSSDLWRSIYIRGLTIRSKRYSFGRFSRWLFFSSVATI
mmetsp:Transcript_36978/g.110750  ORF Transcript_36978/g.110750 Transcript_36978/m.110750 type:complete len:100 (-) Transcript_36978:380-679(-)